MQLDPTHRHFAAVANAALSDWQPTVDRPSEDAAACYQAFDYPPIHGATVFIFYWARAFETTVCGYLPEGTGRSQQRTAQFQIHACRLLNSLGLTPEAHGDPQDQPFALLVDGSARERLLSALDTVSRNRGFLFTASVADRPDADEDADQSLEPEMLDDDEPTPEHSGDDDHADADETDGGRRDPVH